MIIKFEKLICIPTKSNLKFIEVIGIYKSKEVGWSLTVAPPIVDIPVSLGKIIKVYIQNEDGFFKFIAKNVHNKGEKGVPYR